VVLDDLGRNAETLYEESNLKQEQHISRFCCGSNKNKSHEKVQFGGYRKIVQRTERNPDAFQREARTSGRNSLNRCVLRENEQDGALPSFEFFGVVN